MDAINRQIINRLQGGFPLTDRPYAQLAKELGLEEAELLERLSKLLRQGSVSRFAPMYHAERLGGGLTLAAMQVPPEKFDEVTEQVNALAEVAHNYARDHWLNMWFVLATEHPNQIDEVIEIIEKKTGLQVYNFPKLAEYYLEFKVEV